MFGSQLDPKSSIQVVGVDSKNRKQYIYHSEHIAEAEKHKFFKLIDFIKELPKLNKVLKEHEKLPPYDKKRVIVTILALVKKLHMRIGKEIYSKTNKSFGASSLKKTHVAFDGNKVKFRFKGKSNQILNYTLDDQVVKNHINLLLKLQGDKLFQYIDDKDTVRQISDLDVNKYIQEHMGPDFSAKDFRTLYSNMHFINALLKETQNRLPKDERSIKKNILNAIKKSSSLLKHTKSVSKKSYVLNFIIDLYQEDPEYFIIHREDPPVDILVNLLKEYKKTSKKASK